MDKKQDLIAPCGMDCSLCVAYQVKKYNLDKRGSRRKACEGCIPRGKGCLHMGDSCEKLRLSQIRFCYECEEFPCKRLKGLDNRYRSKYHMSMIENLKAIKAKGIDEFLEEQDVKWKCPECGGHVCCHNGLCLNCKFDFLKENKKYRWGE